MKIKQVVVVEGKTDTSKLQSIFGVDNIQTIETNGRGLSKKTLETIAQFNQTRGIIVFTDPDGPGVHIRDEINSYLNYKFFNAFIDKKSIKNSKKIGIAEAEEEDIVAALKNLVEFKGEDDNLISYEEYLANNFFTKENRVKIAKHFNWNEKINAKKLFKWINLIGVSVAELKSILGE